MFCVVGPRRRKQMDMSVYADTSIGSLGRRSTATGTSSSSSSSSTIPETPSNVTEMSLTSQVSPLSSFGSKGELHISLHMQGNQLTVEVFEARLLPTVNCRNVFVQIQLCPDVYEKSKCRTSPVMMCSNPSFNEKFTYELLEDDYKKRMLMSVWGEEELLGCMSFGVNHLSTKASVADRPLQGWYHLLGAELGHRKHLLATTMPNNVRPSKSIIKPPRSLDRSDLIEMVIPKKSSGFGFTVKGSCPVKVGRVKDNSTSFEAGLRKGDVIVKFNGQNVQRSSAETIAKLVRNCPTPTLVLSVHRPRQRSLKKINKDSENTPPQHHQLHRIQNNLVKDCNISADKAFKKSCEKEAMPWEQPTVWDPEMSVINLPDLPSMVSVSDSTIWQPHCSVVSEDEHCIRLGLESTSAGESSGSDTLDNATLMESLDSTTDFHFLTPAQKRLDTTEDNSADRLAAIARLVECEQGFVSAMQQAMEKYSRPLRASILSQQQHSMVFQNVEKLVAISQFHIRQLLQQSYSDTTSTSSSINTDISTIYQPRLQMLCDAYSAYAQGQDDAFALLEQLCAECTPFINFMQKLPGTNDDGTLNLAQFLDQPLTHFEQLSDCLHNILQLTPANHKDFPALCQTMESLNFVCQTFSDSV